jgi:AcrR family transcriptional regulator
MDNEGISGLTMAKVAACLEAGTMSLYRHVRDKADLVEGVAERIFEDLEVPDGLKGDWRGRVVGYLLRWRALALEHPALVDILTNRPVGTRRVYSHLEEIISILREAGFSDYDALRSFYTLFAYVFGFVLWELPRTQAQSPESYMRERREDIDELPAGQFPAVSDLRDLFATNATQEQFDYGLARLVESLDPNRPHPTD